MKRFFAFLAIFFLLISLCSCDGTYGWSVESGESLTVLVPEGKPLPVEPENQEIDKGKTYTCIFSIECSTILNNLSELDPDKLELVPSNGVILAPTAVVFYEGESVFTWNLHGHPFITVRILRESITCTNLTAAHFRGGCTALTVGIPTTAARVISFLTARWWSGDIPATSAGTLDAIGWWDHEGFFCKLSSNRQPALFFVGDRVFHDFDTPRGANHCPDLCRRICRLRGGEAERDVPR